MSSGDEKITADCAETKTNIYNTKRFRRQNNTLIYINSIGVHTYSYVSRMLFFKRVQYNNINNSGVSLYVLIILYYVMESNTWVCVTLKHSFFVFNVYSCWLCDVYNFFAVIFITLLALFFIYHKRVNSFEIKWKILSWAYYILNNKNEYVSPPLML